MPPAQALQLHLRPAFPADAAAMAKIHVDAWQAAYRDLLPAELLAAQSISQRADDWAAALHSGTPEVLVAEVEHAMVGWIAFGRCRDPGAQPHRGEVWAQYVAPSHWGGGVGQALWGQALQVLQEQEYATVSLWVLAGNTRARRFYRQAGFVLNESRERPLSKANGETVKEARYVMPL